MNFRLQKQSVTKNQRRILLKESAHVHVGPDFRRNPNKVFSDLNKKITFRIKFGAREEAATYLHGTTLSDFNIITS